MMTHRKRAAENINRSLEVLEECFEVNVEAKQFFEMVSESICAGQFDICIKGGVITFNITVYANIPLSQRALMAICVELHLRFGLLINVAEVIHGAKGIRLELNGEAYL